jgi:outer membrane protein OmpA-like peptidoglycan-associated protein
MKNLNLNTQIVLFCLLVFLIGCSFPRGVRKVKEGDYVKAEKLFERSKKHKTYGVGARYYLERLKINKKKNTITWIDISETMTGLEDEIDYLSGKRIKKLRRYDAGKAKIIQARENLQGRIKERMTTAATIPELEYLEEHDTKWPFGALDTIRQTVVNKTIDPAQEVYGDDHWKGFPPNLPTEKDIQANPDRSCLGLAKPEFKSISYEDATTIAENYQHAILPQNYPAFWKVRRQLWSLFQQHHSYCEMEQFKTDYPNHTKSKDCWYDQAADTLCMGQIRPLLAFHRNNPFTGLDLSICFQLECLSNFTNQVSELSTSEREQLSDIHMIIELQANMLGCIENFDSTKIIPEVARLAKRFKYHQAVYDLAQVTVDHFTTKANYELALNAVNTLQPLFPDTIACVEKTSFSTDRQAYFNTMRNLIIRAAIERREPQPVSVWNTEEHDEYGLVSWGETFEVFFAQKDGNNGSVNIMTSVWNGKQWTKPEVVPELYISRDVVPVSMSGNGRMMLLKSGGKLWKSLRHETHLPWTKPQQIPNSSKFAGDAWISPDESSLLLSYYVSPTNPLFEPATNIAVATVNSRGGYDAAVPLNEIINREETFEATPTMALGGRLLFFTSDRDQNAGQMDIFSASLRNPMDWESIQEPKNLGVPINTLFSESGITYFSDYSNYAFFHRKTPCTGNLDIYTITPPRFIFPDNALRLAGLVLDENLEPIGGGFMEFTPNFQLNVHSESISDKGTYAYTVEDSTAVVRLFPEIPGYYSERDTTHFLANIPKGSIVRDTFILTSFEYIRQNYELVHSTFYTGTAQFDQPRKAYPELTRLAKIATRMGAELNLTGHTDGIGAEANNKQLSIDRATSVKKFLVEKCGFPAKKIRATGYGSTRPICDNTTEEGRRCNRRVEVRFVMPELKE